MVLLPDMLLRLESIKADIVLQLVQDPQVRCVFIPPFPPRGYSLQLPPCSGCAPRPARGYSLQPPSVV